MMTHDKRRSEFIEKWFAMDLHCDELVSAVHSAERFCARFYHNRSDWTLFVLTGKPGCGKTHIARSIYNWSNTIVSTFYANPAWLRFASTYFLYFPNIIQHIEQKHNGYIQDLMKCDLLILDDVGAENDPWKQAREMFCKILSHREKKATVITTNVSPSNWNDAFGPRVADRLCRNSIIVDMSNIPSYATRIT